MIQFFSLSTSPYFQHIFFCLNTTISFIKLLNWLLLSVPTHFCPVTFSRVKKCISACCYRLICTFIFLLSELHFQHDLYYLIDTKQLTLIPCRIEFFCFAFYVSTYHNLFPLDNISIFPAQLFLRIIVFRLVKTWTCKYLKSTKVQFI